MENVQFLTATSFILHIDMSLYSRSAVLKALSRWTDKYVICLNRTRKNILDIQFESLASQKESIKEDCHYILNDFLFEMHRKNVIEQTSNIRELLIGRALYATCIDLDKSTEALDISDNEERWVEDKRQILTSWNNEV